MGVRFNERRGEVSMATIALGLDLSKQLFSVCELDVSGRVVQRRDLRRDAFAAWLAHVLPERSWRWKPAAAPITGRGAAWATVCSRA